MKLHGSTKCKITKNENGKTVTHLEISEVVLPNCYPVSSDYQQDSRVLYTFIPNMLFGLSLDISPKNAIFLKLFNSDFHILKYGLPSPIKTLKALNISKI